MNKNNVFYTILTDNSALWWSYDLSALRAKAAEFVQDPVSHTVTSIAPMVDSEGVIYWSFTNRVWSVE